MRRFFYLLLLVSSFVNAQQKDTFAVEASFLRGNTLPHRDDIHLLVNGHPEGLLFSFVMKTHGKEEWQRVYDFPDYGGYFLYQDFKSEPLGVCYAVGGFYNFYFLNRHLQLKLAQGIALTTNPLTIGNNNVSRFYLTGKTEDALFNFYFGDGRIEAGNFTVQNMQIYHRGSNDMTVKPMQKITGIINSTGNIILKNVPPIVDVQELYQGRVIYQ